jgi:hypothetical protein
MLIGSPGQEALESDSDIGPDIAGTKMPFLSCKFRGWFKLRHFFISVLCSSKIHRIGGWVATADHPFVAHASYLTPQSRISGVISWTLI